MKKRVSMMGLAVLAAGAAMAQVWQGEYLWTATDGEKAAIEKAVEEGAKQVGLLLRPIARGRLKESTKPFQKLSFSFNGQEKTVTMTRDDDNPIAGPADGSKIEWKRKDKKVFAVEQTLEGNVFSQAFTDEDGNTRVNRHTFSEDGKRLTLEITLNSSNFKTPLKYALTYAKELKKGSDNQKE